MSARILLLCSITIATSLSDAGDGVNCHTPEPLNPSGSGSSSMTVAKEQGSGQFGALVIAQLDKPEIDIVPVDVKKQPLIEMRWSLPIMSRS